MLMLVLKQDLQPLSKCFTARELRGALCTEAGFENRSFLMPVQGLNLAFFRADFFMTTVASMSFPAIINTDGEFYGE